MAIVYNNGSLVLSQRDIQPYTSIIKYCGKGKIKKVNHDPKEISFISGVLIYMDGIILPKV